MLLQVGELARRTGLTVRTLHHYDDIGLLKPSGRSDAGYRLYSQTDVQRLHGIQTLRQMGLPLSDIAGLLAGDGMAPEHLIGQQIRALDQQIAQATELRARLFLLRDGLVAGAEPDMGHWLEALALMATYGKYFSAAELKHIFSNWNRIEADWLVVKEQVRRAMDEGQPVDAPEVQSLAYRWMALMLPWMGGDIDLLERWGHMFRTEPSTQGRNHAPPGDMIRYIESAIQLRMDLLLKHMDRDDLRQLGHVHHTQWRQLEQEVEQLLEQRVAPAHPLAQAAAAHWDTLFGTLCRNDAGLRAKLLRASASEPLLRAGSPLSEPVRAYLQAVPRGQAATRAPEKRA